MNLTTGSDASILKDELGRDEKLLWSGHPDPGRAMRSALPIFFFGIPWTAFSLFWVGMASWGVLHDPGKAGPFIAFPLFGLPFVLIGVFILCSPWTARRRAANTHYGVTDKRVVVIIGGKNKTVQHYDLGNLVNPTRTEYGAKGDISWTAVGQAANTTRYNDPRMTQVGSNLGNLVSFIGIDKPRDVERLVEDAKAKLQSDPKNINGGGTY